MGVRTTSPTANNRQFIRGSKAAEDAMGFAANQMAEKLGHDPDLCKMLIPSWEVGCRRITPGPGYLEAFTKPNCHLTNSPITKISENAVHTADGETHEVDVGMLSFVDIIWTFLTQKQWFARQVLTYPTAHITRL